MDRQNKGYLILFEGGEGSGKSTITSLIYDRLKDKGLDIERMYEPGTNPISIAIAKLLREKSPNGSDMEPLTELFLFEAARSELVVKDLIPKLNTDGKIIILDRFTMSTRIYQGVVKNLGRDLVEYQNYLAARGIEPDLNILLDVDTETGLSRKPQSKLERIDSYGVEFHTRVNSAYLRLAQLDNTITKKWHIVDARKPLDIVMENSYRIVEGALIRNGFMESEISFSKERR